VRDKRHTATRLPFARETWLGEFTSSSWPGQVLQSTTMQPSTPTKTAVRVVAGTF